MKKIVEVTEVEGEGLVSFLGKRVTLFCLNYFYEGKLIGVNKEDVLLEDAGIVYETGAFDNKTFQDRQKLPNKLYVRIDKIESYTELDKK